MKKIFFLLLVLLSITTHANAAKATTLTINYKFTGIEEGYDHTTKAEVKISGKSVDISKEHLQSKPTTMTVKIPKGEFELEFMIFTLYDGVWEEHTIEKEYSIDCFVKETFVAKKSKHTLDIVFDLDAKTTYVYK